jgi:hypothetical protein
VQFAPEGRDDLAELQRHGHWRVSAPSSVP